MWIYNSYGEIIANDLAPELKEYPAIDQLLEDIQAKFDSLYLDTPIEFAYIGFANESEKQHFDHLVQTAVEQIVRVLKEKYEIINRIDVTKM